LKALGSLGKHACDGLSLLPVEEKSPRRRHVRVSAGLSPLPVEEKAAIGLRVRLQLPFLPACRERGRLKDLACAYNGLFRLPVEEKAIMRLACRGQDYFSTRQVCFGPHRLGDFAPLPRPQCRSAAAPRGKLVPSPDRGEEFASNTRPARTALPADSGQNWSELV
jgi:hypothetical protein